MSNLPVSKHNNLTVKITADTSLLKEKLNFLFELKTSVFEKIINNVFLETLDLRFNSLIDNSDIGLSDFIITSWTSTPDELVCIFDLDLAKFLREWLITMRASDTNLSFHDDISLCRGN